MEKTQRIIEGMVKGSPGNGRHRAGHKVGIRCGNRPRQGRDFHGHGSPACAAAGHSLLPQFWHRVDRRRLWRLRRQDPDGIGDQPRLTFRMAQTPVQHYLPMLLERIEKGDIDPSFVITHRASLEEGPNLYKTFRDKKDGCIKVVLKP
jgi:threonine dehydrogenase-like Zn-dependent dehydrogenase